MKTNVQHETNINVTYNQKNFKHNKMKDKLKLYLCWGQTKHNYNCLEKKLQLK